MSNSEGAERSSSFCVNDTLRNSLAVKMRHLLVQDEILKQKRSARTNAHRIFMLDIRYAGSRCQFFGLVFHTYILEYLKMLRVICGTSLNIISPDIEPDF